MRDKKRIKEFCNKLAELWEQVPDMRFFQLVTNIMGDKDFFYMEDDYAIAAIEQYIERIKPKKVTEEKTVAANQEVEALKKEIKELKIAMEKIYENQLGIDLGKIEKICKDLFID